MKTVHATPYAYPFAVDSTALVVIDMQRDFIEPGGFGAALGNDVKRLEAIVPTVGRLSKPQAESGRGARPGAWNRPAAGRGS